VFRGSSNLTLDNKGRLAVPARHRDVLLERCGGHLVITAHPDGCLLIYPLPEWEFVEQRLDEMPSIEPAVRNLQRLMTGKAQDTQMDAAGRVLVSPELRDYAKLDKDVVLSGQGKKFELWDQETLEARLEAARNMQPGAVPPSMEGFSF
jgi:MraZ protein